MPKMNRTEILEKVKDALQDQTGIPKGEFESTTGFRADCGFDDLDLIEFIMKIESVFQIAIPDEDAEDAFTAIDKLVDYLESKV